MIKPINFIKFKPGTDSEVKYKLPKTVWVSDQELSGLTADQQTILILCKALLEEEKPIEEKPVEEKKTKSTRKKAVDKVVDKVVDNIPAGFDH